MSLFDVTDVASDDVLNIRSGPSSEFEILGGLEFDAKRVEVLALNDDSKWGFVSQYGVEGWVYLRYLKKTEMAVVQTFGEAHSIFCSGNEPFWSLDLYGDQAEFAQTEGPMQSALSTRWTDQSAQQDMQNRVFIAQGQAASLSGVIRLENCAIRNTEETGNMTVSLILSDSKHLFLTGCCRLRE